MENSSSIKLVTWNVRSLVNKIHSVLQVLNDESIDIICIQETWLSSETSTTTSIIKQAGYNISHVFRSDKRGAGVAILWREKFHYFKHICKVPAKLYISLQYQCVVFNFEPKLIIISIYRLQEVSFKQFLIDLDDIVNDHFSNSHSLIIVGDFNVHFEKVDLHDTVLLTDLMSSFGLSQLIIGPTHKHGHTLDLIFLNTFEMTSSTSIPIDFDIGDHFMVNLTLKTLYDCNKQSCRKTISYRNLRGINLEEFSADLCLQLDGLNENNDFLTLYNQFSHITHESLDRHAPLKTKTLVNKKEVPWQDSEYRKERALRRKYEREWKKSVLKTGNKTCPERVLYSDQRSKCAHLATLKRSQYFRNLIQRNGSDQSALFKIVSQVLDKSKSNTTLPQFNNLPVNLANRFNTFYAEKVKGIRQKIPTIDSSEVFDFNEFTFTGTPLEIFDPVSVEELRSLLKNKVIKTAYNDVLPRVLMKKVFDNLLPYICDLINLSLRNGTMDGIKESTIVPLLKKSGLDPEILKNYRPVSDIVLISKLIETVVLHRLNTHASFNSLECNSQHGYKKYHSPETLLLRVVNDVLVGFDRNKCTILLLLDLSAAFDTVDIEKLLNILENEFGIIGIALKWFRSFLTGRKQRVRIQDSLSDYVDVLFGVPQGSVLGPVLFNIYIRSLYVIIKAAGFSSSGYADDSNARLSFSLTFQHNIITQSLPELMDNITKWMNLFFLKINPDKTEIILFIPNSLNDIPTINGAIFNTGTCIRFSNKVTNLGVTLDRFLNFDSYINSTVAYCYKLLKDVSSIRGLITQQQTEMLVHSIISSRLDYCNSLLYGLKKSSIDKFQKVQNAAARVVLKLRKHESIRQKLINLHWLRINERISFKLLVFIYKCLNSMAPVELTSLLTVHSAEDCTLRYIFLDSVHGRRSFQYAAPRLWNALPMAIRIISSLNTFKSKLKYHLFNNFQDFTRTVNRYM